MMQMMPLFRLAMPSAVIAAMLLTGPDSHARKAAGDQVSIAEQVTAVARAHRYPMVYADGTFSGPAWERVISEGRKAWFFLLGEEHGIAENALLAAQLYRELAATGYSQLAIEVSPAMAKIMDEHLRRDGLDGLRELFSRPGGEPAFFGMHEEAMLLAVARSSSAQPRPVLWGLDYEVASDRVLLDILRKKKKPRAARKRLRELTRASRASWDRYYEEQDPSHIFSFAADPELVIGLRQAWPGRDDETDWILESLEQTFQINQLWAGGENWRSNQLRANHLRSNFIRYWSAERKAGRMPRVMAKFGASHLVRGRSTNETFDLGALLPEVAALEGKKVFSLLVVAGSGSQNAVLDPTMWKYRAVDSGGGYTRGLEPLLAAAMESGFTLLDLRALRPLLSSSAATEVHPRLMQMVHGYDAMLIMTGATASAELDHPLPALR